MNILQKIYHIYSNSSQLAEYTNQQASDIIKTELTLEKPSMIARLGSTELLAMTHYINSKNPYKRIIENFKSELILKKMSTLSGFYPSNEENIAKFSELMMKDMTQVDILGSWRKEEKLFAKELNSAVKIQLKDLEPYYHKFPWTEALQDKTVLVIHPFEESINAQYKKRKLLFNNPNILPEFKLKIIKSVQSIANNKPEFDNWFIALDYMKNQIDQVDFDIALIGCGAYGFPLAAHVKRKGKKAVLLGGALQILFGIKGKRWEEHPQISKLMNEHWIRPYTNEVPNNSKKIDGGSYW
jgi:hypothetical protein